MAEREIKVGNKEQVSPRNWESVKEGGQPKNSNEIEHDIDQTRDEMDKLIDALAYRLNPKRIVDNYKDKSRKAYHKNKLPLVLAASGTAWMLWEIQKQNGKHERIAVRESEPVEESSASAKENIQRKTESGIESARQKYQSGAQTVQNKTQDEIEKAKQKFKSGKEALEERTENYKSKFQEKAQSVKDIFQHSKESAVEKGNQFQQKNRDLTEKTKERSLDVINRTERLILENPLISGLSAMFAGMIAGLLLPESRTEKRMFGKSSHDIIEKAKESGEQTLEKGKRIAKEATHSFKEETGKQGLSSEKIAQEAKTSEKPHEKIEKFGEKITEAAKKSTEKTEAKIKDEQQKGRKAA